MLAVRHAGEKGRGVFAEKVFRNGEIIERAPVVVVPLAEAEYLDKTPLKDYYYDWGGVNMAVVLGYGSIYNHSYQPNALYVKNIRESVLEIIAIRDIQPGEEILVNYNGHPDNQDPLWFGVTH